MNVSLSLRDPLGEPDAGPRGLVFAPAEAGPAGQARPPGLSSPHIWPLRESSAPSDGPETDYDPWDEARRDASDGCWGPEWAIRNWRGRQLGRQAPRLIWYQGGNLAVFRHPPVRPPVRRGDRGIISRFSAGSRLRLLRKMNKIDRNRVKPASIWMLTLTYPGRWVADPAVWKRDLQTLRKRIDRTWGKMGAYWKLEPQRRGAPHFHLLMFTPVNMHDGMTLTGYRMHQGRRISRWRGGQVNQFAQWIKTAWAAVVGSDDPAHVQAGTSVEPLESFKGAVAYAGKYLGKSCFFVDPDTGEELKVGRFWGEWCGELIPKAKPTCVALLWDHWTRIRRAMRKWADVQRTIKGDKPQTGPLTRVNAMNGITRSCQVFIPGELVRRLVLHYAGPEAFAQVNAFDRHRVMPRPGSFYEWVRRQELENQARNARPPDPETRLGWILGELESLNLWSDDDGSYLN